MSLLPRPLFMRNGSDTVHIELIFKKNTRIMYLKIQINQNRWYNMYFILKMNTREDNEVTEI